MSVINTNIPSITAVHRLASNQGDLRTRLERLSTGLRINRGKDDPAGLIASETLRSEIRGISQAIDNSQRGINVISTAEGALNEISSLLLDIRGLINHAANTGATSTDEISADQLQVDSIIEAIDRIAKTTQFGGEKLINGNFQYSTSGIAASAVETFTVFGARVPPGSYQPVTIEVTQSALTASQSFDAGSGIVGNIAFELTGRGTEQISLTSGMTASAIAHAINQQAYSTGVSASFAGSVVSINSQDYGSDAMVSIKPIDGSFIVAQGQESKTLGRDASVLINGQTASVQGLDASLRVNGLDLEVSLTSTFGTQLGTTAFQITGGGATFQIGPEVSPNGQVSIGIPSVLTSNLGDAHLGYLYSIKDGGDNAINISTNTSQAERIVVKAINQVAIIRGRLGGLQRNQIETNINSQRISLENVTAAESAIRDADIASEVAALTRAQVLVQSTTSILGIANQLPQTVLSLLS